MIDYKDKYIFVHVPRTGGHSGYQLLGVPPHGKGLHKPRREYPEDYYSFGFIRNPWDRMYSCWRRQRVMSKYQGKTFKWYLLEGLKENIVRNQAMHFLNGCDFIGRFENLQPDWNTILRRLGRDIKTVPHLNQYGSDEYRQHYDNEMIDFITINHAADIEYGGYTFE